MAEEEDKAAEEAKAHDEEDKKAGEERISNLEAEIEALKSEKKSGTEARKKIKKVKKANTTLEDRLSNIEDAQKTALESAGVKALDDLSGGDDDEAAKIKYEYDLLNMPADTPDQVLSRYKKASSMVQREEKTNPLNTGIPTSSAPNIARPKDKEFGYSDEGLALARRIGLGYANKKKDK